MKLQEFLEQYETDILLADGFEDAFIGILNRCSSAPIACYDRAKCLEILVKRDGMTEEEAEEFFDFNVAGAYVGEQTPFFLDKFDKTAPIV